MSSPVSPVFRCSVGFTTTTGVPHNVREAVVLTCGGPRSEALGEPARDPGKPADQHIEARVEDSHLAPLDRAAEAPCKRCGITERDHCHKTLATIDLKSGLGHGGIG